MICSQGAMSVAAWLQRGQDTDCIAPQGIGLCLHCSTRENAFIFPETMVDNFDLPL